MSKQAHNPKNDEFARFQELAKNLLVVPKKEVDQQKAAYERNKKKKEKLVK